MIINGVEIYRELNEPSPGLLAWLEARDQVWVLPGAKGEEHHFIDNDLPRDSEITDEIVANTRGFALFTEEGGYVGSYRSLDRALKAQAGAKVVVQADVEGAEPDEDITITLTEDTSDDL